MTGDAKREDNNLADQSGDQRERVFQRIDRLYSYDEQFRNANPDLSLQVAARQPGLRLPQILEMFARIRRERRTYVWVLAV